MEEGRRSQQKEIVSKHTNTVNEKAATKIKELEEQLNANLKELQLRFAEKVKVFDEDARSAHQRAAAAAEEAKKSAVRLAQLETEEKRNNIAAEVKRILEAEKFKGAEARKKEVVKNDDQRKDKGEGKKRESKNEEPCKGKKFKNTGGNKKQASTNEDPTEDGKRNNKEAGDQCDQCKQAEPKKAEQHQKDEGCKNGDVKRDEQCSDMEYKVVQCREDDHCNDDKTIKKQDDIFSAFKARFEAMVGKVPLQKHK
jgi:hypothetical protein